MPNPTPGSVVTAPATPTLPAPPLASGDRTKPTLPGASVDGTAPKIVVTSPRARTYKVGQTLKIKISGTDDSGLVRWTATVRRSGGEARTVKQGTKLRLSRTGSYVLRVTAKDRSGNTASKTVRFRVVPGVAASVDGPTCYVGPSTWPSRRGTPQEPRRGPLGDHHQPAGHR